MKPSVGSGECARSLEPNLDARADWCFTWPLWLCKALLRTEIGNPGISYLDGMTIRPNMYWTVFCFQRMLSATSNGRRGRLGLATTLLTQWEFRRNTARTHPAQVPELRLRVAIQADLGRSG